MKFISLTTAKNYFLCSAVHFTPFVQIFHFDWTRSVEHNYLKKKTNLKLNKKGEGLIVNNDWNTVWRVFFMIYATRQATR